MQCSPYNWGQTVPCFVTVVVSLNHNILPVNVIRVEYRYNALFQREYPSSSYVKNKIAKFSVKTNQINYLFFLSFFAPIHYAFSSQTDI